MMRNLRRVLAVFILVISITLIGWASLPNKHEVISQAITPGMMKLNRDGTAYSLPARQVVLDWPTQIHVGEDEMITLTFQPVAAKGASIDPGGTFADIYSQFSMMAEGRYAVAGLHIDPANPRREAMPAGQPLTFRWHIRAAQSGEYEGTTWLSLRYLPLDGGQAIETPIYIHPINIKASSLLGLSESTAYLLGGAGILLGVLIVNDDLIAVFRRLLKSKTSEKIPKSGK